MTFFSHGRPKARCVSTVWRTWTSRSCSSTNSASTWRTWAHTISSTATRDSPSVSSGPSSYASRYVQLPEHFPSWIIFCCAPKILEKAEILRSLSQNPTHVISHAEVRLNLVKPWGAYFAVRQIKCHECGIHAKWWMHTMFIFPSRIWMCFVILDISSFSANCNRLKFLQRIKFGPWVSSGMFCRGIVCFHAVFIVLKVALLLIKLLFQNIALWIWCRITQHITVCRSFYRYDRSPLDVALYY